MTENELTQTPDEMLKNMLSAIPEQKLLAILSRKEDYTANVVENRSIEELPQVITYLSEIFRKSEDIGIAESLKDEYGIDVDLVGTRGYIPRWELPYNKQANFSAIFTTLEEGVYQNIYKTDRETGMVLKDEDGNPIIEKKIAIHGGVVFRNKNQLNQLAVDGLGRIQQLRTLNAFGNVSPVGLDGSIDRAISGLFGQAGKKKFRR